MVEVPSIGGRSPRELSRRALAEIIEPRLEEIFALAQRQLIRSGLDESMASGVVLTGGSVVLDGIVALAERVFGLPVRIGTPLDCEDLDESLAGPAYAAAIGLVRYGMQPHDHLPGLVEDGHLLDRMRRRMAGWFRELV
jgi:cell division protein FtsA